MKYSLLRLFFILCAVNILLACQSLEGSSTAAPAYVPRVAVDAVKNPKLPSDIQDCQKRISEENSKGVTSQHYMVLMRGCLIQQGHIMLN
jgi:hypothetical protein